MSNPYQNFNQGQNPNRPQQPANPYQPQQPAGNPYQNVNPYAAPTNFGGQVPGQYGNQSNAEQIRNFHLSHEASIKSFGFLYLLGAVIGFILGIIYVLLGIVGLGVAAGNNVAGAVAAPVGLLLFLGVACIALSSFQLAVGLGLRNLVPWTRIASIVLSCIGLLGFPVGTLISGYFLYLLLSEKGQYIFSPDYARVVAATPHIKYRTSILVWIFLGLLLLAVAAIVIAAMASVAVGPGRLR